MKSNRTVYWFEVTAAFFGGTGGPSKEQGTNKPPPTGRVWERPKGDTTCPTTPQNPCWHPSWLNKACTTRKDSELKWLAKDNPETTPITIRPETVSHVAEQFSWVPLPYCFLPGCPFPIKSLALSAHVFPQTIHFRVLDKSPVLGPGRGPSSSNNPMDCSYSGSSVYGIFQERILEWVPVPYFRWSSQPRNRTCLVHLLHWEAYYLPLYHLGSQV